MKRLNRTASLWEIIAAIGQIVGAAVVALSLIYLGTQIRFANRLAKAEAFRAIAIAVAQVNTAQANDPTFRRAFHKMYVERSDRDGLEADERIALGLWLGAQLNLLEQVHREVAIGILPPRANEAFGIHVYRLPYFRATWPHLRPNYSPEFSAYMDNLLAPTPDD